MFRGNVKNRICATLFILLFIFVAKDLWLSYSGLLTFDADLKEGSHITLQYRKKQNSNINKISLKTHSSGRVAFPLKGKTLSWFKLSVPENTKISQTQHKGWKKQNINMTEQNEYVGKTLKNDIHITSWCSLLILICLGYYLWCFLLYLWKNGLPTDSPNLPKMMNLEFLRIIFMVCVVLVHISKEAGFFSKGGYGVEFFFILSGFLLALTYNNTSSLSDFMQKKIIRFLPLIIFCGTVNALRIGNFNFSNLLSDWFFGSSIFIDRKSYVSPAWYIAVLFWVSCFYFYMLKTQRKEKVYTIIGLLTFFAYVAGVRFGFGGILEGLGSINNIGWLIPKSLARGLGGIGLGFFIGLFFLNQKQGKSLFSTWQYTLAETALLFLPCVSMFYKPMFPDNPMILIVAFSGLLYLFAIKKGYVSRFFEKPIFAKMSRYTLAIYLSHQSVVFTILIKMGWKISDFSSQSLGVFVYLAASCIVGVILHHVIELPVMRFLKEKLA